MESRESLVILAIMEERVTEVFRGILDLQASQGCKDLLANLVCQVLLVNKAMLDHLGQKETLAPWDPLAFKVLLVIKDPLDLRALLV